VKSFQYAVWIRQFSNVISFNDPWSDRTDPNSLSRSGPFAFIVKSGPRPAAVVVVVVVAIGARPFIIFVEPKVPLAELQMPDPAVGSERGREVSRPSTPRTAPGTCEGRSRRWRSGTGGSR
jgi:hypothetical protein